jgi:hypothetical protein
VVALQAGAPVRYDPRSMSIPNAPAAEQYLRRNYRGEWSL